MAPNNTTHTESLPIIAPRTQTILSASDMAIVTATEILSGKAGYRQFGFVELLTPDGYNPKTKKGRARGYSTAIMHFAPANLSGYDVCQYATEGCTASCLNTAGHGGIVKAGEVTNDVQRARVARTRLFFLNTVSLQHSASARY